LTYDVVIVGAGPAGIFAAMELAEAGLGRKTVILEKGNPIDKRNCPLQKGRSACARCPSCSVTSGWGGAGAFSDGKLTLTGEVGGSLDQYVGEDGLPALIKAVDGTYRRYGAPEKVYGVDHAEEVREMVEKAELNQLKLVPVPIRHLGTGRSGEILERMHGYLTGKGVEVRTGCQVESILVEDGRAAGVLTAGGEVIRGRYVVIAPGREGSDWLRREAGRLGLALRANPVDIGVRVEVPGSILENLTRIFYESKLIYYSKAFDDKVRTFCMNPYGAVVMENNDGLITVNGHTHAYHKTKNTNFAVLVSKNFTEPFDNPIAYGRYIASLANLLGGGVIVQRLGDLLAGQRSTVDRMGKCLTVPTLKEATPGDLSLVFPYRHLVSIVEILKALDGLAPGVFSRYTLLYGVEVKFYSSRLELGSGLETRIENLFAAGDGAGVTRGLVQASASGLVVAREILRRAG
jgi:uncharacterized FAD-dependent dehydrogenase